jgi:Fe-S oxidoreductase
VRVTDIIECARKELYDNGFSPEAYRRIAGNIQKSGNPYAESRGVAETLGVSPKKSETGYFMGCTMTYRRPEIARAKISILKKLDPSLALVDSVCCGSPLKRTGGGGNQFEKQVEANLARIKSQGIKTLIFSCAGCYKTFKHDYPKTGIVPMHITEFLNTKQLKLKPFSKKVVYHDPCHLGRGTSVYDAPRELLKKIPGIKLVEMGYTRTEAHCCGGGGGMRAAFPDMAAQIAGKRMEEAKKTGAEVLVTSCPFCVDNLRTGEELAKTGIKIMDITQLIDELME